MGLFSRKVLLRISILSFAGLFTIVSEAQEHNRTIQNRKPLSEERINDILNAANRAENDGQFKEAARLYQDLAWRFYNYGQHNNALSTFEKIATMKNVSKTYRIASMRMVAQISMLNLNQPDNAKRWCNEILSMVKGLSDDNEINKSEITLAHGQALHFLAELEKDQGDLQKSYQYRKRLIDEVEDFSNKYILNNSYWEIANYHSKQGNDPAAVRAFDELLQRLPEFIQEKGVLVDIKLRRAQFHGYARTNPEHLGLLEEIWNDPNTVQYLRRYEVGRQLIVFSYKAGDYNRSLRYGAELLNKLEQEYQEMKIEDRIKYGIDTVYSEVLSYMADTYMAKEQFYEAIPYLEQLLILFPESPCGIAAQKRIADITRDVDSVVNENLENTFINDLNSVSIPQTQMVDCNTNSEAVLSQYNSDGENEASGYQKIKGQMLSDPSSKVYWTYSMIAILSVLGISMALVVCSKKKRRIYKRSLL